MTAYLPLHSKLRMLGAVLFPPYAFMTWCLITQKYAFKFYPQNVFYLVSVNVYNSRHKMFTRLVAAYWT